MLIVDGYDTAMPQLRPAVGDGTTRGGLVGHYATLASTLRCDPCHVCATKPSSPPRVTLTLYRPFRTILQKRDCLLHVRYRDGARVIDILAYICSMLPEPSGNENRPFALASRPKYYRSRPPPYPRLRFGLRAYDTYRENATRSPCSSLVLRRSYSRDHSSRGTTVVDQLLQKPQQ